MWTRKARSRQPKRGEKIILTLPQSLAWHAAEVEEVYGITGVLSYAKTNYDYVTNIEAGVTNIFIASTKN